MKQTLKFLNPMHPVKVDSHRKFCALVATLCILSGIEAVFAKTLLAQAAPLPATPALVEDPATQTSIIPTGTDTQVTTETGSNQYNVTDGTLSGGEAPNLFHQFQEFDLGAGDTANFDIPAGIDVRNIINLIGDTDASVINGLLQVSTDSPVNLYLVNPNGVLFGDTATLNLSGSFVVSTADSLLFDDQVLDFDTETVAFESLVGDPTGYIFSTAAPGLIENTGDLSVNPGESITFLGGTVQNNGNLSAPEGDITLAAVPGESLIRLSQTNSLLSLEISPLEAAEHSNGASLPVLLTGGEAPEATTLVQTSEGTVVLTTEASTDLTQPGSVVLSGGTLDVSGQNGGDINLLGVRIALLGTELRTDGELSGGGVYAGGIPEPTGLTASSVFIDRASQISATGQTENGGSIYIWSHEQTRFYGQVDASGVTSNGDVTIGSSGSLEWRVPQNRP